MKVPTDYQLRSVDRSAQQAQASIASAKHAIADADARLAAARALVLEAKERRDDAERTAVHQIAKAGDHAVKPSSIWEAIQSSAAWQAFVVIATVVLTIVSIVAIFVGGPIVWAIIAAATLVLIADALMQMSEGKDMTLTLILLVVGLIPGGRAISSAAKIADAFRAGDGILGGLKGVALELGNATKSALIGTIRSLQKSVVGLVPGVVSVLHSLPNAVRDAAQNANVFHFADHLIGTLKNDFAVASNHAWGQHIIQVGSHSPSEAASLSQGSGAFHGIDPWHDSPSSEPRIYEIGAGGDPSGFMLADGSSAHAGDVASQLWPQAQVPTGGPNNSFRGGMWGLQVDPGVPVAESVVTANPLLGQGGAIQGFVPGVMTHLQPGGGVTLIDRVTGAPYPAQVHRSDQLRWGEVRLDDREHPGHAEAADRRPFRPAIRQWKRRRGVLGRRRTRHLDADHTAAGCLGALGLWLCREPLRLMPDFSAGTPWGEALRALDPILAAEKERGNRGRLDLGDSRDNRPGFRMQHPLDVNALKAEFEFGDGIEITQGSPARASIPRQRGRRGFRTGRRRGGRLDRRTAQAALVEKME